MPRNVIKFTSSGYSVSGEIFHRGADGTREIAYFCTTTNLLNQRSIDDVDLHLAVEFHKTSAETADAHDQIAVFLRFF